LYSKRRLNIEEALADTMGCRGPSARGIPFILNIAAPEHEKAQ
jgi:hypothetical protein